MNEMADPVSVEQVLQTIRDTMTPDQQRLKQAETAIRHWESDASPGFLISLLRIVEEAGALDTETRALAAIIAKNTVGSSWRKVVGSREWSRVPDEERAAVRDAAVRLLLSDSDSRVAAQLGLLIANIALFDFPGRWEGLLAGLLGTASNGNAPPAQRLRALKALEEVLAGLTHKRFVMETPKGAPGVQQPDLLNLTSTIHRERELFKVKVSEVFEPLQSLFMSHCQGFLAAGPDWQLHGTFAKAAAKALYELLRISPSSEGLPPGTQPLLEQFHVACGVVLAGTIPAGLDMQQGAAWLELGGRVMERLLRCSIAYLDNYPVPFATFVPAFLALFIEGAVVRLEAEKLRSMRAKQRVFLVRFIARALLCPFYRPEWVGHIRMLGGLEPEAVKHQEEQRRCAAVAHDALAALLSNEGGRLALLVEAVIAKYVALTAEELEEWQTDPEGYLRSMDVESSPDAETPRPIGVGLLLCMLERGGETVAQALINLAARLQAQSPTPDALLLREATYRAIGEGYSHVSSHIDFKVWYANELGNLLEQRLQGFLTGSHDVMASVLQARALWLVGVCGGDLDPPQWTSAYRLTVAHLAATDLVVALTALSSQMALAASVLEDQQVVEQLEAQAKASAKMALPPSDDDADMAQALQALELHREAAGQSGLEAAMAEVRERMEPRLAVMSSTCSDALGGAFTLLGRLSEVESMVRVLQLVSVLVEVLGERVAPHLSTISSAITNVWSTATGRGPTPKNAEAGALVRLHSALIAVLTHLVNKLRTTAMSNPLIQGVVIPLLHYATGQAGSESEVLADDAYKLWLAVLSSQTQVTGQVEGLLPNLARVIQRGKDNAVVFPILEAYLLMGASAALQPYSAIIVQALAQSLTTVETTLMASVGSPGTGVLSNEFIAEATAASALSDVMLQLYPDVQTALLPTFRRMAAIVASPDVPVQGVNVKVVNMMEAFLEVLGRVFMLSPNMFVGLVDGAPEVQGRFMDKWLAVASARFLEEMLGIKTMAMLGRFRRRIATIAMAALVGAGGVPALLDPPRLVQCARLAAAAVADDGAYAADQRELDTMDFKAELGEDYVVARRLEVARRDIVRTVNLPEAVRNMFRQLATQLGGEQTLISLLSQNAGLRLVRQMQAILGLPQT